VYKNIAIAIGIVCICLLTGVAFLSRPTATQSAQNEQLVPTPVGISPLPTSSRPEPTAAGGSEENDRGIQSGIRISDVTEITPSPIPTPMGTIREEYGDGDVVQLFVQSQQNAQEVRLGNDQGDASFGLMTHNYVVWRFDCYQCDEQSPLQTGLYAYDITNGEQVVISQEPGIQWDVEADDIWILYVDYGVERQPVNALFAYNLDTNERMPLGDISFPTEFSFPAVDYYALNQGKAAWIERGRGTEPTVIHILDLLSDTKNTFVIPELSAGATYVDLSSDILVWWDGGWKGYSISQDSVFSIPITPPGWEQVPITSIVPVTVTNEQMFWGLEVAGKVHHLTASVVSE
jgi:hypothetical protein